VIRLLSNFSSTSVSNFDYTMALLVLFGIYIYYAN
jgi:hypothetical protein